jgi:hypothetical protein
MMLDLPLRSGYPHCQSAVLQATVTPVTLTFCCACKVLLVLSACSQSTIVIADPVDAPVAVNSRSGPS